MGKHGPIRALFAQGLKRCARCKATKPLAAFSKDKNRFDGYNLWCRACHSKYRKRKAVTL